MAIIPVTMASKPTNIQRQPWAASPPPVKPISMTQIKSGQTACRQESSGHHCHPWQAIKATSTAHHQPSEAINPDGIAFVDREFQNLAISQPESETIAGTQTHQIRMV